MRNVVLIIVAVSLTLWLRAMKPAATAAVAPVPVPTAAAQAFADPPSIQGLAIMSTAKSRAITAENPTGEPGKAAMATEGTGKGPSRELGVGWKVSPSIVIKAKATAKLADITGTGSITHIWATAGGDASKLMLRAFWDGQTEPAIDSPYPHFFAAAAPGPCSISSMMVCVNPSNACNCYWPMPFRKSAKFTLENTGEKDIVLYYQIDYTLADVPAEAAYFHARYHRADPIGDSGVYTILDTIHGRGQYVGTYLMWEPHSDGWWGEGEVKFFIDGDQSNPTICGTGTEDYFCGSYDFLDPTGKKYRLFNTPYTGLAQVNPPDQSHVAGQQLGMYRWHITDPIRFTQDLKVTIHALGWKAGGLYRVRGDDAASSVAYWYQG